jgi:hypothetical protein
VSCAYRGGRKQPANLSQRCDLYNRFPETKEVRVLAASNEINDKFLEAVSEQMSSA